VPLSGADFSEGMIWLFREKLATAGAIKILFERFDATLRPAGHIAMPPRHGTLRANRRDRSLQPIIDTQKFQLASHRRSSDLSNPIESEWLSIFQVFRTVQVRVEDKRPGISR
jgi:hypothetical protein